MRLSQFVCLAAVAVSGILSLDPTGDAFGTTRLPGIKYLPVLLMFVAAMMSLGSALARRTLHVPRASLVVPVCYVVLVAWIGSGAVVALSQGARAGDTFIGRALSLSLFPSAIIVSWGLQQSSRARKRLRQLVLAIGVTIAAALLMWRIGLTGTGLTQAYHEEVFLIYAASIGLLMRRGARFKLFGLALAVIGLFSFKNTSFLLFGLETSMVSIAILASREFSPRTRLVVKLGAFATVLLASTLALSAYLSLGDGRPTGSLDVRLTTYGDRINTFLANPLVGAGFTKSPLLQVGALVIPSHSDVLDLLAFGGLAAGLLFLVPLFISLRAILPPRREVLRRSYGWVGLASFLAIAMLIDTAVNPVLIEPRIMIFFAIAIGSLVALSRRCPDEGCD